MTLQDKDLQNQLDARLEQLPQVVKNAIMSADVEKRLRTLADTQKLHLDQWQILENEVMLTLLGFQQIENLEKNIKDEVGVSSDVAHTLAASANELVFEPIREELERQLEHPAAQAKEVSDVEAAQSEALGLQAKSDAAENAPPLAPLSVAPATPPSPVPDIKAARPSESSAYKPGEPSSVRAVVHDDPYRESPV